MMGYFFAILFGLSAGGISAAGVFALITVLNLLPRFAEKTGTRDLVLLYEWMIIGGGILGNLFYFYRGGIDFPVAFTTVAFLMYGFFTGIFVGCLVMSLAETLDGIAIFGRRLKLTKGVGLIVIMVAFGKLIGAILQFWYTKAG